MNMENISDFVEKAIGAEMMIYESTADSDERVRSYFVIDSINEQDNGTYDVVSTSGEIVNMPSLEDIEETINGSAYYIIQAPGYIKMFKPFYQGTVTTH